jgi:hypothetical protein
LFNWVYTTFFVSLCECFFLGWLVCLFCTCAYYSRFACHVIWMIFPWLFPNFEGFYFKSVLSRFFWTYWFSIYVFEVWSDVAYQFYIYKSNTPNPLCHHSFHLHLILSNSLSPNVSEMYWHMLDLNLGSSIKGFLYLTWSLNQGGIAPEKHCSPNNFIFNKSLHFIMSLEVK